MGLPFSRVTTRSGNGVFVATPTLLAMGYEERGEHNANRNDEDEETEHSGTDPGNDEGRCCRCRRHTFEMFISKIESVAVYQGMLGRIFNYGTVEIRGTGGSAESFATIAAPLLFRDAIQLVQSDSEKR